MQLKYRGVSYETNPTQIEIVGKNNKVMFRGCCYYLSGAVVNFDKKVQENITYRGISIGENQERRFMGQAYSLSRISLAPMIP